jgi:Integrase core domain
MGELGARCREFLDQRLAVLRSAPLVGSRQGSFQVVQREFGAVAQGAGGASRVWGCRLQSTLEAQARPCSDVTLTAGTPNFSTLPMLTDCGTEYCGNSQSHEYQLYLAIEDIDHTRTKTKSPQTNGICERFHRTVLDEFYRVAFRKKIYTSIEALQADLDIWVQQYNEVRSHQGRWCYGKTPMQTFLDSLPLAKEKLTAA